MYIQTFSHLFAFYLPSHLPESVEVDPSYDILENAAHTQQAYTHNRTTLVPGDLGVTPQRSDILFEAH